jgi:hypothetical protein
MWIELVSAGGGILAMPAKRGKVDEGLEMTNVEGPNDDEKLE